jgi:rhodanese-related sulfurtransferase
MIRVFGLLLLVFALAACGSRVRRDFGGGGSTGEVMILQDAKAVEISLWEGAIVFDLRDYESWVQGHIQGARLTSVEDIRDGRDLPQDRNAPILFMGEGPQDIRPELAAESALEQGYTNVQLFPGGWRAWLGLNPITR